jgi:hypothetical protein
LEEQKFLPEQIFIWIYLGRLLSSVAFFNNFRTKKLPWAEVQLSPERKSLWQGV